MPNALQQAGALSEPSNFAPLHTNRIFTGLWTNRNFLRDAATNEYQEKYGMGRQDSILDGYNSEITPRLTLARRAGSSVYNGNSIPPVNRFYSFNTFTLTAETIRVLADTASNVLDISNGASVPIFTKSSGAQSTYFLGVGNTLYMTNGVDNKQIAYDPTANKWGTVYNWGIQPPAKAPTAAQVVRPNPYGSWASNTVYQDTSQQFGMMVQDHIGHIQHITGVGTTGAAEPNPWNSTKGGTTTDGTVTWTNVGASAWANSTAYNTGDVVLGGVTDPATLIIYFYFFGCTQGGTSLASGYPGWVAGIGSIVYDGSVVWKNLGMEKWWDSIGPNVPVVNITKVVDSNGYLQEVWQPGKSQGNAPQWQTSLGALTLEQSGTNVTLSWINRGSFSVAGTGPILYGYAYVREVNGSPVDGSNMSPQSAQITMSGGTQVVVQGDGSTDPQVNMVYIYRTAQGGSTFLYLDKVANPSGGQKWTYTDVKPDSALNAEIQAQVAGEGTPLPSGATCLGYHLGRIFAAVGNVVWISSGPDAAVATFSGNAGFDTTFTAQSKITRFWACSLGMVVFTVRDAYIILGSATSADPLYMTVFIEDIPLLSYDCFTVNKTTPYLLQGNNTLISLDPSAGIMEIGFPIADRLDTEFDPSKSYCTFHKQSSRETALYVATGYTALSPGESPHWYRMAANNAPETGSSWSPQANFSSLGCVQSVEVNPGVYRLLMSGTTAGPILQRDRSVNTDNGTPFACETIFGSIVLALPGQLAALSFITLESVRTGTRATLALLLGEHTGTFEVLDRTRQDPTNLPPSNTIFSDRYHFSQNQQTVWCRHFQMQISWLAEDAANELLTFTIFGQTWQEMRAQ